jgi:hypothetical protein
MGFFVIDIVHRFPAYVREIKGPLHDLQDAVVNGSPRAPAVSAHLQKFVLVLTYYRAQWLIVLTIQTSMLIEGVLEIAEATTDIEVRNHLKSRPVWEAALAYASIFSTFLDLFRT